MKVIVAGSRDGFCLVDILKVLDTYSDISEIVCGEARGPDTYGRLWAERQDPPIPVKSFPADWVAEPRRAGYIRNADMADYADVLIAFWDGHSKGTKHMIDCATKKNLLVIVYNPE